MARNTLQVPDRIFDEPRLAAVYDALDPDRSDLDAYVAIVDELKATSIVDVGWGTGTFAVHLALRGLDVTGVDPAGAMLDVARRKAGADRVRWVHGTAADLPPPRVDLVTMTGNVAQVFLGEEEWMDTLVAAHRVLRPAGALVFESRQPERRAWLDWNRDATHETVHIDGVGVLETWNDVIATALPLVTFRGTMIFHADGTTLTSDSTLRFRSRDEIVATLDAARFDVVDVRDAPDRPGKENVFIAVRR
jgi:ubiquinone/menaquinone biosynthesis C-methylase UbiE